MRIIAGLYKGKKVEIEKKSNIRPTMSKVREAVFNIIAHSEFCNNDLENIKFLDLFCGSGIMGIEAISRGIKHVTMVDIYPTSCIKNIMDLNLQDKVTILQRDILDLKNSDKSFDIIFMDPPYNLEMNIDNILENSYNNNWFKDDAVIMIEHDKKLSINVENDFFKLLLTKSYGRSTLSMLSRMGRK